jgi:hypothetical protein
VVIWDDTDLTSYARHREGEPLYNPASNNPGYFELRHAVGINRKLLRTHVGYRQILCHGTIELQRDRWLPGAACCEPTELRSY